MEKAKCVDKQLLAAIKSWFSEYLEWLMTHQYSIDEMNAKNNHATCWVMQVASFARLTGDEKILEFCRQRYREILLPDQMADDGSFPQELRRTKPYGYSLFNLDAMTMVCLILSDKNNDLINYQTPDGKSLRKGIEFLYPFVADKDQMDLSIRMLCTGITGQWHIPSWYSEQTVLGTAHGLKHGKRLIIFLQMKKL